MKRKSLKILLFGYINVNVIDGSSFFLSSLASMLSDAPEVEVDLVLANPLTRSIVLDEILARPNVNIIDPFADRRLDKNEFPFLDKTSMSHYEAAKLLSHYWTSNNPDVVFIRSTEVGAALASVNPEAASKCALYVTGVVTGVETPPAEVLDSLETAIKAGTSLICQTDEMKDYLSSILPSVESGNITALHPMVPDNHGSFEDFFLARDTFSNFVYAGKFAVDWNPGLIISGFLEAHEEFNDLSLNIAGDQFKSDPDNPLFIREIRYLLSSSAGVDWAGGIPRSEARQMMLDSDVGIGWRAPSLDNSLELSTKLLEYGSFARPCIMNRTPMHERIFGSDYPLYANTMTEFVEAVRLVRTRPDLVRMAAKTSFEVARHYTYSESFKRLVPLLLSKKDSLEDPEDFAIDTIVLKNLMSSDSNGLIQKESVVYADTSRISIDTLIESTSDIDSPLISDSLGPFVAVTSGDQQAASKSRQSFLDFYVSSTANAIAKREIDIFKSSVSHSNDSGVVNSEEVAVLRKQLSAARQRAGTYKSHLESLQKSRLGRLQVEFWKSRKKKVSKQID